MIEKFISILSQSGYSFAAEDVADVLWLGMHLSKCESINSKEDLRRPQLDNEPQVQKSSKEEEGMSTGEDQLASINKEPKLDLYLPSNKLDKNKKERSKGIPFRTPTAAALPGKLQISRAFRPLMRKVSSRTLFEVDINKTVDQIADKDNWMTVLRPKSDRWLDLFLVVDQTSSMDVWKQTTEEFKHLLESLGAFKNVNKRAFISDENGKIRLYNDVGQNAKPDASPLELMSPVRERLVIVVSDCVSECWYNGEMAQVMALWGSKNHVAIMQMLPRYMWARTVLGLLASARLFRKNYGINNKNLVASISWEWSETSSIDSIPVPVITTDPSSILNWTNFLLGKTGHSTAGFLFPFSEIDYPDEVALGSDRPASLEQFQIFQASASPTARKLAGYMAAAPLSLAIMRLVQKTLLPESGQTHLAEFFLSGMIYRVTQELSSNHPVTIQYEFHNGIRERLLSTNLIPDTLSVLIEVSKYISKKTGMTPSFRALLEISDRSLLEEETFEIGDIPFGSVIYQVLNSLGGKFSERISFSYRGDELANSSKAEKRETIKPEEYSKKEKGYLLEKESFLESNPDEGMKNSKNSDNKISGINRDLDVLKHWLQFCAKPQRPKPAGIKWDVFISYRSVDRVWAVALYDMLVQVGYEVFFDLFVLVPGQGLSSKISKNLSASASGILIWSKRASDSEWVEEEVNAMEARQSGTFTSENPFRFVVATLDNEELPALLKGKLYFDFSEYPDGPMGADLVQLTWGLQGKPPNEEVVRKIFEFEEQSKEESSRLRALASVNRYNEIAEKIKSEELSYTTSSTLSGVGVDLLLRGSKYEMALEAVNFALQRFPKSVRLKQLRGLALRRKGELDEAVLQLTKLYQAGHRDTETLGMLASVWADKWENLLIEGSEFDARDALERSRNLYLEGFEKVPHDYYTGINAASKSAMLGDLNQARMLADQVLNCLNMNREDRGGEPAPHYWERVTEPEAYLLKGEWEKALSLYHDLRIAHFEEKGSIASTGKQVSRLLSVLEVPQEIASKLRDEFNL